MKQRMINVFTRKLKVPILARICANIGYGLLLVYYAVRRLGCINKVSQMNVEQAREIIEKVRPKPSMTDEKQYQVTNDSVDLSIIMPAYNVEQYIGECIYSIINQQTKYCYELIIVNDGATDYTEEEIKKIQDAHIKYVRQENRGLSGARNTGINCAVGKYITFVDSDDVMTKKSIDTMMDAITKENADIVVGGYYTFMNDSNIKQYFVENQKIIENNSKQATKNTGYAWGKIYKREMFETVRFPLDAWYEDTLVCSVLYRMAKKVVVIDQAVYGYRINPEGISRTARASKKSLDHYWVMEDAIEQANLLGIENDEVLYEIVFNHMSTFLYRRISSLSEEVIEAAFIMACDLLNKIRTENHTIAGGFMRKDIDKAFKNQNYNLWKLASFLI